MVEEVEGSILLDDSEMLVNPVNCMGVSGKGLALLFKRRFALNFAAYRRACKEGKVVPGVVFPYFVDPQEVAQGDWTCNPKFIANFPTKRHWLDSSRMEDIHAGLLDLVFVIERLRVKSVAIPKLGCGLGGLEWDDVRKVVYRVITPCSEAGVRVRLFV